MPSPLAVIAGTDPRSPEPQEDYPLVIASRLPQPHHQHQCDHPQDRPQRHEDHETGVLGLVPEEHHAHPAAQSPAQARHPQQHPLRDAAASLVLRLRLVHAIKDEAQEVDEDKV